MAEPRNTRSAGPEGPRGQRPEAVRPRRGRPHKFGRPSQVVALTLPDDVLDALRRMHPDPGWAIVQLVEPLTQSGRQPVKRAPVVAELAHLPGRRALIVVQPQLFSRLTGVSTIPLSDGRAFLAFDQAGGIADLEVAVLDRIEELGASSEERKHLLAVRDIVRNWRRDPCLVFHTKSIIVVEGGAGAERRPLARLETPAARRTGSPRPKTTRR